MKDLTKQIIVALAGLTIAIAAGGYGYMSVANAKALEEEARSALYDVSNEMAVKSNDTAKEKSKLMRKSTGVDADMVASDRDFVVPFFEPAFTWTNGEGYDSARKLLISELGSDSTFVTTYMPVNETVDQYNKIDVNNLKSKFDKMVLYPLSVDGDNYTYLGVVDYYVYKEKSDLDAKRKLTASEAIIEFTLKGKDDNRVVTNVKSWSGFNATGNTK